MFWITLREENWKEKNREGEIEEEIERYPHPWLEQCVGNQWSMAVMCSPGLSELEAHVHIFITSVLPISLPGGVQGMGILLPGRLWNVGSVSGGVSVCVSVCAWARFLNKVCQ